MAKSTITKSTTKSTSSIAAKKAANLKEIATKAKAAKAKAAIVETDVQEEAVSVVESVKKDRRTKEEIFAASLAKVKSTGNEQVDAIARKVVTAIHDGSMKMESTDTGYEGTLSEVTIKVDKVTKGKTSRYVLSIGEVEVQGSFAAKSYKFSKAQNRPAGAPVFDDAKVASVAALLDI